MPLHDDEMNKRREKREAQRRKQQAEAKRMKRTLFLAVLVLCLCGGGIWYLTRGMEPKEEAPQVQQTQAPTETTKATSPLQKDPITRIHLVAAGDVNITDSVIAAGVAVNGYDYSGAFKDVASILAGGDLTVLNFEGNVCGEPYGSISSSAPTRILEDLRSCGVDLLQMANSCSINNGINGLTATLQNIRGAGIEPLGAYATASEFRNSKGYTIAQAQGVKVAFVAFTKGLSGRGMPAGSEDLVNLLYEDYDSEYIKIDTERIEKILKDVEAEKPDVTVAMLHWGSEYNDKISKTQEKIVSLMKKRGVDIIIGSHSHTLQPIVFDRAAGTLVAYSLGDFFGEAIQGGTNYSIILDIEISKDTTTGNTRVTDYSYTPIYTVTKSESPEDKQRVVRIDTALAAYEGKYLDSITKTCKEGMEKALTRIEERLVLKTEEDEKKGT